MRNASAEHPGRRSTLAVTENARMAVAASVTHSLMAKGGRRFSHSNCPAFNRAQLQQFAAAPALLGCARAWPIAQAQRIHSRRLQTHLTKSNVPVSRRHCAAARDSPRVMPSLAWISNRPRERVVQVWFSSA
jgi:hypothetical protein